MCMSMSRWLQLAKKLAVKTEFSCSLIFKELKQEWGRWNGLFFGTNSSPKLKKKVPYSKWFLCPSFLGPYVGLPLLKHTNEFSCLLFIPDVIRCLEATLAWEEGWELPWLSKGSHADSLSLLQQWRWDKQVVSGGKGNPPKEWDFFLLPS